MKCVAVRCSVLQCVAVRCTVLQCVAVRCSVLQCIAVCCSVLQYVEVMSCVKDCALLHANGDFHSRISESPIGWLRVVSSLNL